jgi:hemoglobin
MTIPSPPVPEGPERRALLTQEIMAATGLNEPTLERVVRAFYDAAQRDPLLGPKFDHVADWEAHIARITAFWSSVALMSGRYHGQPMAPHLKPEHFTRWLELFEDTARRLCTPAGAERLIERAHRIAQSLRIGIEVHRGVLPRTTGQAKRPRRQSSARPKSPIPTEASRG